MLAPTAGVGQNALQGVRSRLALVAKEQFGDEQVIAQILPCIHLC